MLTPSRPAVRLALASLAALFLAGTPHAAEKPKGKEAAPDDGKDWKVDGDHGPSHTISFTTDKATWMPLDVHPDGSRIVFSLLGDLYLLPIAGSSSR